MQVLPIDGSNKDFEQAFILSELQEEDKIQVEMNSFKALSSLPESEEAKDLALCP